MEATILERGPYVIEVLPVLADNFVYLMCRGADAVLIDAGEAEAVIRALDSGGFTLREICITHRHGDHSAALGRLRELREAPLPRSFGVIKTLCVPGHTSDDRAFYVPEAAAVFTGDCLINGACGRPVGGTPGRLFASLQKIKQLPPETLVLGGHDYLEENLEFTLSVEADNTAARTRLERYRAAPAAALFVTLEEEVLSNVFLRAANAAEFAALRERKNRC